MCTSIENYEKMKETEKFERIVPVSNIKEEHRFISNMYCPICKKKKHCVLVSSKKVFNKYYEFKESTIFCENCSSTFKLKFFNPNSEENKKRNSSNYSSNLSLSFW